MDSPHGQEISKRAPGSGATRLRLLSAAAELIADVGWGRVTTRAVAERAGLPHGAVSYHFRGKQELLTEAALQVFEHAFSIEALGALATLTDLVALFEAWLGEQGDSEQLVSRVGIEAMLESERNPMLRERMAALMRDFRRAAAEVARADQEHGRVPAGVTPEALATLLSAVGDGLFLHTRLDKELDTAAALAALRALLTQ